MLLYLDQVKQTICQLKPVLTDKYHVRSIGLFGSVVRDDFSPETSDIDIIIDFTQPIGIEFVDIAYLLEQELDRKVDLVSRNGIKDKYFTEIQNEIMYV
ncbi:MAG: nucleotidyltransferase domain-containing protein [Bacteroidales bacterium]|jgi:predicted nucleotidyltransferase|nr:nucleotidyltransferase domain-containing protein [Bacteroidales bacterium]